MADIASDTFPSPGQLLRTRGYSEHTGDTVNRYREIRITNNISDIASDTFFHPVSCYVQGDTVSMHTGDTVNKYREIRNTNNMSDIASDTFPSPSQL